MMNGQSGKTRGLTLLVLAAGEGRRFGGKKQFEAVGPNGETILEYSVFDAIRAGFGKVVFVVGAGMEGELRSRFIPRLRERIEVEVVVQEPGLLPRGMARRASRRKPWGTGHAVLVARGVVETPFAVVNSDDHYACDAFTELGRRLVDSTAEGTPEWYLVGYRVTKTLSKHGPVSRGVCRIDAEGFLLDIAERTGIQIDPDGHLRYMDGRGNRFPLSGDEVVSMNLFGFTESLFALLEERFAAFLEDAQGDEEAEFFLPSVVNAAVAEGRARVRALPTIEEWKGMTYREDLPIVKEHIHQAIDKGSYPPRLW